jgi:hypothetical protein
MDAISRGDISMAKGTYDLYPESGDYETFDSDEEGGDDEEGGHTTTVKTKQPTEKSNKKPVNGLSRSERRAAKRLKSGDD